MRQIGFSILDAWKLSRFVGPRIDGAIEYLLKKRTFNIGNVKEFGTFNDYYTRKEKS